MVSFKENVCFVLNQQIYEREFDFCFNRFTKTAQLWWVRLTLGGTWGGGDDGAFEVIHHTVQWNLNSKPLWGDGCVPMSQERRSSSMTFVADVMMWMKMSCGFWSGWYWSLHVCVLFSWNQTHLSTSGKETSRNTRWRWRMLQRQGTKPCCPLPGTWTVSPTARTGRACTGSTRRTLRVCVCIIVFCFCCCCCWVLARLPGYGSILHRFVSFTERTGLRKITESLLLNANETNCIV